MTAAAVATQPLTAAALLFGDGRDGGQALAQALHEQGVLGSLGDALQRVSQAGRQAAGDQVAAVAHGLFDLDLGDLVIAGWRKQGDLASAAERTAANPGSSEVVELASHRISSVHRPYVDLLVDDVHVATLDFELDLELLVRALVVTVRNGQIISLHSGTCDVAATLSAKGIRLIGRRAHFELPLMVRWPLGLHLDAEPDPPPRPATVGRPAPAPPSSQPRTQLHHPRGRRRRSGPPSAD
jgi:hypothetical protein